MWESMMVLHTQKASSLKKRRATSLASELICVCNDQLYEAPIALWKLVTLVLINPNLLLPLY
jgi:hypothetical protein